MVEKIELSLVGKNTQQERLLTLLERGQVDLNVKVNIQGADQLQNIQDRTITVKIDGLDAVNKFIDAVNTGFRMPGVPGSPGRPSGPGGVPGAPGAPGQPNTFRNASILVRQTRAGAVDPELQRTVTDLQRAATGTGDIAIRARDLLARVDKARNEFQTSLAQANRHVTQRGQVEVLGNRIANAFGRGRAEHEVVGELRNAAAARFGLAPEAAATLAAPVAPGLRGTLGAVGGVARTALAGGAAEVGGELGALGGPVGVAVGVGAGLLLDKAIEGIVEKLHGFGEALSGAIEKGREFQESVQAVAAGLQVTTRVTDASGKEVSAGEAVEFNQAQAIKIQKEARRSLTPLGITGNAEAQLVSRILTGASSRGFSLDSGQTTKIATNLGAAAQVLTPGLLGTQRGSTDIEEIVLGSPTAKRTSLGQALKGTGVLEAFSSAKSSEQLTQASDLLSKFVEALKNSNLALQSEVRIVGTLQAAQSEFGAALLEGIGPALKEVANAFEQSNLSESLGELGRAVGEAAGLLGGLAAALVRTNSAIIKGGADLVNEGRLGIKSITTGKSVEQLKKEEAGEESALKAKAAPGTLIKGTLTRLGVNSEKFADRVNEFNLPTAGTKVEELEKLLGNKELQGTPEFKRQEQGLRSQLADFRKEKQVELEKATNFGTNNSAAAAAKTTFAKQEQGDLKKRLLSTGDEQFAIQEQLISKQGDQEQALARAAQLREQNVRLEQELAEASAATVRSIDDQIGAIETETSLRASAVQGVGPERDLKATGLQRAGITQETALKDTQIGELSTLLKSANEERRPIIEKELEVRQLEKDALAQKDRQLGIEQEILGRRVALKNVDQQTIAGKNEAARFAIDDQVSKGELSASVGAIQKARNRRSEGLETAQAEVSVERAQKNNTDTFAALADWGKDLAQAFKEATRAIDDFSNTAELSQLQGEDRVNALDEQLKQGVTVGDVTVGAAGSGVGLTDTDREKASRKFRILQLQRDQAAKDLSRTTEDNSLFGDNKDKLVRQRDAIGREQADLPLQAKEATLGYLTALNQASTSLGTNFVNSVSLATETLNKLSEAFGVKPSSITPESASGTIPPKPTPTPTSPPSGNGTQPTGSGGSTGGTAPTPTAQGGPSDAALNRLITALPGALTTAVQQGFQTAFPGA